MAKTLHLTARAPLTIKGGRAVQPGESFEVPVAEGLTLAYRRQATIIKPPRPVRAPALQMAQVAPETPPARTPTPAPVAAPPPPETPTPVLPPVTDPDGESVGPEDDPLAKPRRRYRRRDLDAEE